MSTEDDIKDIKALEQSTETEIQELLEKLRLLEKGKRELSERRFDLTRQAREELRERERLDRIAAEREAAELMNKELSKRAFELEELAKDKRWANRILPHQLEGAKFLAVANRAICADSMGLGKTLQSLAWLDMVKSKKSLIICPGDVMKNFVDELKKYTDRPIGVIGRMPKAFQTKLLDMYEDFDNPVIIINYESWNRNLSILDKLIAFRFDAVIIDEAHTIKETSKRPYFGVEKIVLSENCCPECSGRKRINSDRYYGCEDCEWTSRGGDVGGPAHRSVKYLLPMTGTPILNRPDELFPLLHLVNDNLFKYASTFKRDFCKYDSQNHLVWKDGGKETLANTLSAYYLRRTMKSAGIILPDQTKVIHEIEFDEELYPLQHKMIELLKTHAQIEVEEGRAVTLFDVLALITRTRQAIVWPGGITIRQQVVDEYGWPQFSDTEFYAKDGSPKPIMESIPVGDSYRESIKIDKAVDLIRELNEDGQRVVVFSQFKTALAELHRRLMEEAPEESSSIRYDGDTPTQVRDQIANNFNREFAEQIKWMNVLCHYRTGGQGLNLTAATAIVILDENWNPGMNQQAYDRTNRIGQTEKTQVHVLRVIDSIDEWLSKLIESKRLVVDGFDELVQANSEFSMDFTLELRKLLER